MIMDVKELLSLLPSLVDCFHAVEHVSTEEWFYTSSPVDVRLGSRGETAWLLGAFRQRGAPDVSVEGWLGQEERALLYAGGQGHCSSECTPPGKISTPIPVLHWTRGQRLSQNLLSLQLPLYERVTKKAPESLYTLIASGDVYTRANQPLQETPGAGVVCYSLWVEPSLAKNHGVFISSRKSPSTLDFMPQKPSLETLGELAGSHLFLMDIGIWLLDDKAVQLLMRHSCTEDGKAMKTYDLYVEFGLALGKNPRITDSELNQLLVAILPLPGGEFYHYGTNRELISSALAVQNLVKDQYAIIQRRVEPRLATLVQNAVLHQKLTAENSGLWIENSYTGEDWMLRGQQIITGVPEDNWNLSLPEGIYIDVVPAEETSRAARPYGFNDLFKGALSDMSTLFVGKPILT